MTANYCVYYESYLGGHGSTRRDVDDGLRHGLVVWVDTCSSNVSQTDFSADLLKRRLTSIANDVVRCHVRDGLPRFELDYVSCGGMRAGGVTYPIIVRRTYAGELALVDAIYVELLEDGVGGGRARKKSSSCKRNDFHTERCMLMGIQMTLNDAPLYSLAVLLRALEVGRQL